MKNLIKTPIMGFALAFGLAVGQVSCSSDSKNTTSQNPDTSSTAANNGSASVHPLDSSSFASLYAASTNWKAPLTNYNESVTGFNQFSPVVARVNNQNNSDWNSSSTNRSGGMAPEKVTGSGATNETVNTGEKIESIVNQVASDVKQTGKDVKQTGKKVGDKIENGAEQVGENAKETGKDAKETGSKVGKKVGTAAKNTAEDVTETGSKVGKKVGSAAKETGKDVKEAAVKGAKAVDKTADKAGEKVKDVVDGKKENE